MSNGLEMAKVAFGKCLILSWRTFDFYYLNKRLNKNNDLNDQERINFL